MLKISTFSVYNSVQQNNANFSKQSALERATKTETVF